MPNILSSLFSTSNVQIVNTSTGVALPGSIKYKSARLTFPSHTLKHTLETGQTVVDTRILDPITAEFEIFIADYDVLADLQSVLADRTSLFSVTSKGVVLDNMLCESFSMAQTPQMLSASPATLVFKEILQDIELPDIFAQAADASNQIFGIQLPTLSSLTVSDLF